MEITYASPSYTDFAAGSSMPTSARPVRIIPLQHPDTTSSSSSSSPWAALSKWKSKVQSMTWVEWLALFLPCSRWIRTYKWREYLQVDLMSGITVGVMLVPQVTIFNFRSLFGCRENERKRKENSKRLLLSSIPLIHSFIFFYNFLFLF